MKIKVTFTALLVFAISLQVGGQIKLSLEDCRTLALENNLRIQIADEHIGAAGEVRKSARTSFLPNISANGLYTRSNKKFSLLDEDKFIPVVPYSALDANTGGLNSSILSPTLPDGSPNPGFDADVFGSTFAINPATGQPFTDKDNNPAFGNYAWLPREEGEFGNKNLFVGALTLTQPIYLGGKVRESYKITQYGERLAVAEKKMDVSEVLYKTEATYWQVISLTEKVGMAKAYIDLLERLNQDLENLFAEGIIIQNDLLKASVKLNEAELALIKAQNGVALSKMVLCQIIGLPLQAELSLTDELSQQLPVLENISYRDSAVANRPELLALEQSANMARSGVKLMRSRFMPDVGLTANYLLANPNPYDGFVEEFGSDWNVGLAVSIPIFHWGDRNHTLRAAKFEQRAAELKLEETRDLIRLEVQQALYRVNESDRKVQVARQNLEKADENLRVARDSFAEGILKTTDVLESQALWKESQANYIDAKMERNLNRVNLKKVSGHLK